jgi:2-methylcitrate dehydratase PrpD
MSERALSRDDAAPEAGLTRRLGAWIAGLRPADVPAPVGRAVRLAILDTLGAALYGRGQPWSAMARDWAGQAVAAGNAPSATVWGEAEAVLRPADAALANAVAAHAFELDDFVAKLHPGAVVVPAALAMAEVRGASGRMLECAVAAGYETMIRTSLALDPSAARLRGWHLTGVCGPLGAAAAAAVLAGLDEERTAWALGLAATQGAGLFAFNADGAMSKRLHPGFAAASGLRAVEMAALGLTGPTSVLETPDGGYLKAFSDVVHPEALTDALGREWRLADTYFKPYACCGSLHSYVDAALELRRRHAGPPPVARRVRAGLARVVDVQCGFDYRPGTELNAQMNARYCIATALLEGAVLPPQFARGKLSDPDIVALAERIELLHDPALDRLYPANYVGWVEVETGAAGDFERAYVLDPSGSTANPEREAALRAKFRQLLDGSMPADAVAALEAAVDRLDDRPAAGLLALLARGA